MRTNGCPALAHPPVDLVDQHRRRPDALDLPRLLDRPLGLHQPAGGDELDALGEQLAQPRVLAHADVVVLEDGLVTFRRLEYPAEETRNKIYAVPELDNALGDRLMSGR